MSEEFDAIERNFKNGDTRSAEWLLIQQVRRLDTELRDLRKKFDEQFAEPA